MTDHLLVVAVEGRALPREDARFRMIDGTDAEPSRVPNTIYYRRALRSGDLRAPQPVAPTPAIEVAIPDFTEDKEA